MKLVAKKIFHSGAIVIVVMLILQMLAMQRFWYWVFPWFDIVMHGLGGIFLGIMTGWALARFGKVRWSSYIMWGLVIAVIIGGAWEALEHGLDLWNGSQLQPDPLDTKIDLLMDASGGLVGGLLAWGCTYRYARKQ